jgi:tRNA pseudouridine55 synthase
MKKPTSALWLVSKPLGLTSLSSVESLRKSWADAPGQEGPEVKMCHGGTLDPFATGLLLVLVGQATKLFSFLHDVPKTYLATIQFGRETDTLDASGQTVSETQVSQVDEAALNTALQSLIGWSEQIPPSTSNVRIDGERAYTKAHRGEHFVLPPKKVFLHEAKVVSSSTTSAQVRLVCRGGFFVRSLARDVGQLLKVGGHLSALHRESIGPYTNPSQPTCITGKDLLSWLPSRNLNDTEWGEAKKSDGFPSDKMSHPDWNMPWGFPGNFDSRMFHLGKLMAVVPKVGVPVIFHGGI